VLSALGMLVADVTRDYSASVLAREDEVSTRDLERRFRPLVQAAGKDLGAEGFPPARRRVERLLDVRYVGQSYEITLPFAPGFRAEFDRRHARLYGYANPARPIEVVNVRVAGVGVTRKPRLPHADVRKHRAMPDAWRRARFDGRSVRVASYRWTDLRPGAGGRGPAVITGGEATAVIPPGFTFTIDGFGNVVARSLGRRRR
jgi:N-methylhydantoinase A/oxoprolinase/acetone carboxylase beta subunit